MAYKFFDKKSSDSSTKNENMSDQQLAEKLHKPIARNFKERKVQSPFIDNIWGLSYYNWTRTNNYLDHK